MERTFTHPSGNGFRESVGPAAWVSGLVFGPFFYLFRRAWACAFISAAANVLAFGISLFVSGGNPLALLALELFGAGAIAWALQPALANSYLRRGWHEHDAQPAH